MPIEMKIDNNHLFNDEILNDQDWILDKPISVFSLDPVDRRVLKVADKRDAVQKKTFTKWMNYYLSKKNGLYINDLYTDLRDGHLLLSLLEIFTNQTIPRERGRSKFHALRNIEQALQCLKQDHNIRLVNIRPEELLNGNPKLTLGLIWRIILHFQFADIPSSVSDEKISPTDSISASYRQMLLDWARKQCENYPGILIDDFTRSWRNGRAFLVILHRHNPNLIDIKQMYRCSNRENLIQAFDLAQKYYGITQLIDPEDVDTDEPDEKSILLYIAHLYKVCPPISNQSVRREHDQILLDEYTSLTSNLLEWIKTKLDLLNQQQNFETLEDFQSIKTEELGHYNQLLHQIREIHKKFETLQSNESLQPDIESINSSWDKLEKTIYKIENNLKNFTELKNTLDLIEQDITNIELKAKQIDSRTRINYLNEIQIKLEEILNYCQTLSLTNQQIEVILEKINQLNLRINIHLTSTTIANGFQRKVCSPKSNGIEHVNEIPSPDHLITDNITNLIDELHMVNSNLNILDEFLRQQIIYFYQTDFSTSNNNLLILYDQHKEFENNLLSQASRIQDIRNTIRQEYHFSSHQELRSLVNQTTNHVQHLFTTSKTYSDQLALATKTLNLLNNLTNQLIELETHLASQPPLIDDENHIHRQLNDINNLYNHLQILEKSFNELLLQSKQINNEQLIHISEQLNTQWKQISSEITQRKRSITQITESYRSFKTLFEQEERILHQIEKRIQILQSLENNSDKLQQIINIFNELLSRFQSIEHINDLAVKFFQEIKMHEKNLKTYHKNLCEKNPHLKNQRQYIQNSSRIVLNQVELFDKHYANLLATIEEYLRLFQKNGYIITLPIDSASSIVHLYRSTITSRYNLTLDDDQDEKECSSSSSAKRSQEYNNNKTGHRDSHVTKGFIDLSHGKVVADRSNHYLSTSSDGSISVETTYIIPATEISSSLSNGMNNDLSNINNNNKKVRFVIQKQKPMNLKSSQMIQQKNLSFVDAVNSKYLDLSTGLFSSPTSFVLSSSYSSSSSPFSSSTSPPDQHRHSHNHFSSSSSSPPHTTITNTTNNKNLLYTSSLSVNNHPPPVGADSATTTTNTTTTITLKEAIDTNILDARSAYVVDTLEQRNYNLREAYSRGLINSINHHIIDRQTKRELTLSEALKMGILKIGDPQSYNITSKTESLIISSVFDHRLNKFIEPNLAIRTKILDPYHGLYLNNLTQESISIDDAMSKGWVIVEQQPLNAQHQHHNDKYVISTSLIRETRSYHLLGVRDYLNNKELSVQEAIRIGILDKQNGQYINRKTNEILSISEAIAQGHIRAQPLPVESTINDSTNGSSVIKRGTVKETKTYTLKSAIHPKTRQEIPIRLAIDEGIIDHAKGFYVNSLTGENLPISVAIEKGLIFTELIDTHPRRFIKTLIIEQVIDPLTNRRLGVTEAVKTGLLNSTITHYYHTVKQKQLTILEAYEQGLILGKFCDTHPSSFYGDQKEQVYYLITSIIDIRTDKIYNLQDGIQQKLFDQKKGVYINPITGDEINIGEAVKRGFIQVQAVSSQIIFNNNEQYLNDKYRAIITQEPYGSTNDSRSKLSIRIESQPHQINEREKDVVEIESIQRLPRHKKQHTTREEEIIEHHTTNIFDRDVFIHRNGINRPKSNERQRQQYIEEVIVDDGINNNRRAKFDIKEDRHTLHKEIVIEGERYAPPPPKDHLIIHDTHREHEVRVVPTARPQPPPPPPRPVHIDDRQRESQRIHHGELIIDDHQRPYPSSSSTTQTTVTREYIDITENRSKPPPIIPSTQQQQQTTEFAYDEQQSWTEEEWEQWHCILMIKDQPYRVVWVLNTSTGDRLPLQIAYQRGLVDTKQRLFFDEKLNRQSYSFEKAVELGYMGIEPDAASLPINVDGIDYMIHWVLDSSTKRRIFPRQAVKKQILDAIHGRYVNPYNNSQVSLHEAIYLKFIGATEYNSTTDSITVHVNGQTYTIKWVYDTRNLKKILPRDALRQGILDIQLNEYRKFDTNDIMTIYDAIQAGFIRCSDDDTSSDNSIRPPSIISIDEDELTIATKTATYVITSVIHPLTQKEIKVSEAIDLGILDKDIGSYKDLVTNVQYELAEAINEGLVYATIIETKEDTEMLTSSVQEIIKKFIVKSVAVDSESKEKIGGLEAQAIGILNYAQGVYHDRKYGVKIPLDKAIERNLLEVELISQRKFEEYDLELITDTITEKRITLYRIHGVRNNVLDRMESGAIAVKSQMIDTEAKTYTDFSTGDTMTIQEAINRNLIQAEISEHVERKPLGLSMQNAIRLGFYVAETGTFRDPATEHYMTLMEAIERGHIHVNGIAFADSEQGPITLYDAFSLGLINRRDGGKLNPAKINLYRARLVESKLHRMNVEDAIRCGLLNLRTGLYKHPHSGEQLNLKEAIQRGLIDGQSTIIEHPTSGRFMTLKDALDGIRIDNEGQVIDSYSNKTITTLELAFNHRKLFSQFDVNAGEVFIPSLNEAVGFEKAIRKNLLDNNRMKLFDPKTSREYTIQDAIERGLIDQESGLIYDTHSHTQYSIREALRHGIVAIVGAPLVPIKADHETVAAKITSRKHRRHSLAKSSLHYDYNSAPDSADEDSHGSGWHRIKSKARAISPISFDGTSDLKRNSRRRTGSSPSRTCRDDDWKKIWKNRNNDDDDDDTFGGGGGAGRGGSKPSGQSSFYSTVTTTTVQETNQTQGGQTSSTGFQQKQEEKDNSTSSTVIPKVFQDSSLPEQSILDNVEINIDSKKQDDENCLIHDINNIADRLTLLHNQLNQYVDLTNNLDELRINVQEIQKLHSEIEKEKLIIENLLQRTTSVNPQLTILITDLEAKRVDISNINRDVCSIIERFIDQVEQFNTKHVYLTEWLEINTKELENNLQLSTLNHDNDRLKNILHTGIVLQNDFKSLEEYLQMIHLIIKGFEQATENSDNENLDNIFKGYQQDLEILSENYSNFIKHCQQISDQCERYMILFNEMNHLNEEFLKSLNEFNQHLSANEQNPNEDNILQGLLLNIQQQLEKLSLLASHELPLSTNHSIQNQLKERLSTILDSHTERYNDAEKRLMHHFKLLERIQHERQTLKERIKDLYTWLLASTETNFFSKRFSLKRSKLDQQIIEFRQFYAQLQTRRHSFDSDINSKINREQLLDNHDKNSLILIEQHFQSLDQQANEYNQHINLLSTRLNEFHIEHAHLIDTYSKYLRLYTEQIQQNDDWNFSSLQLLDQDVNIDHTLYNQLLKDLVETKTIEDENEILEHERQVNQYKIEYEKFHKDLKLILQNRQLLLNQYEFLKNQIQEWLISTDRLLKQQLNLQTCRELLTEHSDLPIDQLTTLTEQLTDFYSSINLLNLTKPKNQTLIYEKQTDELIENYLFIKQRLLQYIDLLEKYQLAKQTVENSIEKAKELVILDENIVLSLDNQSIETMLQKYKGIADQLKSMTSTIDEYKSIGLTLINTVQRYIDTDSIQNEINSTDKIWSEYMEYILDTVDYIQLHQEDLREFFQLADQLLTSLDEKQADLGTLNELDEQIELLNQKGEVLLQSSSSDSNENQVEHLLEIINQTYENLTKNIKNQYTNELHHYINEIETTMNDLSDLLVSSTSDIISIHSTDNIEAQNELDKRKATLEQVHSDLETLKQKVTNPEDMESIKVLDEKRAVLDEHWLTIKQANDFYEQNRHLIQTNIDQFWSKYNELSSFLDIISQKLLGIHSQSTSIEHKQEKYNEIHNEFLNKQNEYDEFHEQHCLPLLILVSNNEQETDDIQSSIDELKQKWNRIQTDLENYQNQLSQVMTKSNEFNAKFESVSTWFDETSSLTVPNEQNNSNQFEHIRTVKEHLDNKYLDVLNLKHDYTETVDEQFEEIDTKWTKLNEQLQEHKTLVYETALRQNRLDDVIYDITQSLDSCELKFSVLSSNLPDNDIKHIEILLAKFRILLNDIELISYDIEQLKQNNYEDQEAILLINNRWEELLKQTKDKYHSLENQCETMKSKQKLFDKISHELDLIDKQINQCTIHTNFILSIEHLESLEQQINKEFTDNDYNQLIRHLSDIKQRTLQKYEEFSELTQSIEHFHQSLQKFLEHLTESERYLNLQKPIQRHFRLFQTLLKQIDQHKSFENRLETYKQDLNDLERLATKLIPVVPKNETVFMRNSLVSIRTRWQKILTRTIQRTKELDKIFQDTKKMVRPVGEDIDRIKNEVHQQTSLCQCSNKYDVQQIAEGRYRFGGSQSLRLVRILRSTVMVRVGGGWTALDEFLVRHDPCRAKGRTNYELHPENYALRDGVAQTMTLFKPKIVTVHRPTCIHHQQQQSLTTTTTTPVRSTKDKARPTSAGSLTQPSNGDFSTSGDDLSMSSPRDSESKQSHIPVPTTLYTPAPSNLSRTSSRESILSEHSFPSTSSTNQRRPSKLPVPISRSKKATNGTEPVTNS